jgi:hypothetical protein
MTPESGYRFPAFAKPAATGEGRSDKIMLKQKTAPSPDAIRTDEL